jgi:cytochrome c-type biogenesis protein CcmH
MTGWLIASALVLIVAGAVVGLGRLPRATWELVGAALLLGLAGYAWQGSPGLAGSPRAAAKGESRFDEALAARRRGLSERFGPAGQWFILSDGLGRQGKTREAANVLVSALRQYPKDATLWVGLGNALVAHGGGMMSPSADFAFRRAMALDPNAPAGPYFYGLALARSGQLEEARRIWTPLAARIPPKSDIATELRRSLALIDQRLDGGAGPAR